MAGNLGERAFPPKAHLNHTGQSQPRPVLSLQADVALRVSCLGNRVGYLVSVLVALPLLIQLTLASTILRNPTWSRASGDVRGPVFLLSRGCGRCGDELGAENPPNSPKRTGPAKGGGRCQEAATWKGQSKGPEPQRAGRPRRKHVDSLFQSHTGCGMAGRSFQMFY